MLNFMSDKLNNFRACFSRTAAFKCFVVIVAGLVARRFKQGITTIVDALSLSEERYPCLIHFFYSRAFSRKALQKTWLNVVREHGQFQQIGGRNILLGDGTKQPKEGRRIPGTKRHHQDSEDVTKPTYIFGHMLGCIGVVVANAKQCVCMPLVMTIQEGLKELATWSDLLAEYAETHTIQIIRDAYEAAVGLGSPAYCILDRYFLTRNVIATMDHLNEEHGHFLDIVTRAKNNAVAYKLPVNEPGKRGAPRKRGDKVKLVELFDKSSKQFVDKTINMYGKDEKVQYLSLDLLWKVEDQYRLLRYVLVKSSRGQCILVSTDLEMDPVDIIKAYSIRFKIEVTFKVFKHDIGGFAYRFWTRSMPKIRRYRKREEPTELSLVTDAKDMKRIVVTVEAIQRYLMCSCIALGLVQMIALRPQFAKIIEQSRYLRTRKEGVVSEASVMAYFQQNLFRLISIEPDCTVSKIILEHQKDWEVLHTGHPTAA